MGILKYPENIIGDSDYIKFTFYEYKAPYSSGPITGPASGSAGSEYNRSAINLKQAPGLDEIVITMPNDISSSIAGNWGGKSFGGLPAAAFGVVGSAFALAEKNKSKDSKQILSELGRLAGAAGKTGLSGLAEDLLRTASNELSKAPGVGSGLNFDSTLGLVSSYITNPNTELLYEGTQLRNHGYTFKMIAQTETEARAIDKIATTFKQAAAPKGDRAKFLDIDVRNFIGIPNVCKVSFYQGGVSSREHDYLPRFKTSAITNVSVDYITEGQYMTFEDGRPIGLTLQVSFRELKLLFAEEIGEGNKKFR